MRLRSTAAARAAIAIAAALPVLGGCGGDDDDTPVACLNRAAAYVNALGDAPGRVLLRDGVPISDCLAENQQGGDLATVGTSMVEAATKLNAGARAEPGGVANLQLGYLLGAVARGADGTEGIHADLLRRLTAAARYSPRGDPLPQPFSRVYRRGYEAGLARG